MDEQVAIEFAADVEQAVASVRELTTSAQECGVAAKEAQDGIAEIAAPAAEAAAGIDEVAGATDKASESLGIYYDAAGRARLANGQFASSAQLAAAGLRETTTAADDAAGAQERTATAVSAAAAAQERFAATQKAQADAAAQLAELQKSGVASTEELTAATNALTDASVRAAAARKDLATMTKTASDEQVAAGVKTDGAAAALGRYKMALVGIGVGAAVAVDAAGKFQDSTTHLVTDAGESAKNLALVQQGILSVSAATGTSATDITNAMYHIESAGMHGASGLAVLKVAAEGAKVGGADLDTVSKTLTGTLNAYGMTSENAGKQTQMATQLMNQLITTVGSGDMRMQDLASSLSNVAPLAAAAHIQFAEVGGAIATMTAQGMSARQATQDLSNTIRALSNPNNVAIREMQQMGLSSQQVSQQLGQRGLTGTLSILTKAIADHMGPDGQVIQSTFQASTQAAKDADVMIKAMPPNLQKLAQAFMNGSVTSKQWTADLKGLDPVSANLMKQFAGTAEKAHSFNSLLTSGSPAAQTYTAALAKVMGGATGLNTALMLTGGRMQTFIANTAGVYNAGVTAGNSVQNWSTIQGTFNFKLQQATASLKDAGIALGSALLPAVSAVLGPLAHFLAIVASNKAASIALAVVVGGILAGALGLKLAKSLKDAAEGIKAAGDGIEWLIGKMTGASAATEAQAAATDALTAAKEESVGATEAATAAQTELDVAMDANPIGLIILAIVALIAIIVLVVTHLHFFAHAFDIVRHAFATAGHDIAHAFDAVRHAVAAAADAIAKPFIQAYQAVVGVFDRIKNAVTSGFDSWWKQNGAEIKQVWDTVWKAVTAVFRAWWAVNEAIAKAVWAGLTALFRAGMAVVMAIWRPAWDLLSAVAKAAWTVIETVTRAAWVIISAVFSAAWAALTAAWRAGWDILSAVVKTVWAAIQAFTKVAWDVLVGIFTVALDLITGHWSKAWNDVKTVFEQVFNAVQSFFKTAMSDLTSGVTGAMNSVVGFFAGLPGRILSALGDLGSLLLNAGKAVIQGLINGIESAIGDLGSALGGVASFIVSHKGPIDADRLLLVPHGHAMIAGLIDGIRGHLPALRDALGEVSGTVASTSLGSASLGGAALGPAGGSTSVHVQVPVQVQAAAGDAFQSPAYQQALQAAVQEVTLRYAQVNTGNGFTPAWGQ